MRPTHSTFTGNMTYLLLVLGLCVPLGACAGKNPSLGSPGQNLTISQGDFGARVDRSRCDDRGKQVVSLDANTDGKPDVIKIYEAASANGQAVQQIVCKQTDLDFDGKVDLVQFYGPAGDVVMDEYSMNYSGTFNGRTHFQEGKKIRAEKDMDFDGKPDYFEIYEGGRLVRIERDKNRDGNVDEWQYFEGGRLDRIGYDTTGAGRVDKWERNPEGADAPLPVAQEAATQQAASAAAAEAAAAADAAATRKVEPKQTSKKK